MKDLCLGLGIEVAELQEIFLWKSEQELADVIKKDKPKIADELADIFVFLAYISHDLGIDLNSAIQNKVKKNSQKYPIEKAKGNNKKYDKLWATQSGRSQVYCPRDPLKVAEHLNFYSKAMNVETQCFLQPQKLRQKNRAFACLDGFFINEWVTATYTFWANVHRVLGAGFAHHQQTDFVLFFTTKGTGGFFD